MGVQCQGISGPHVFSSKTLWLCLTVGHGIDDP
jgi:hypothetical protein